MEESYTDFRDKEIPRLDGSELQGDGPMVLTQARGHYCRKEHSSILKLAAFYYPWRNRLRIFS